jgi:hypothetical protein
MQDSSILDQTRGRQFFGPELIQEVEEQIRIIEEDHWNLRKEIMCTSRCHHFVE